jgi:hypothetical protein
MLLIKDHPCINQTNQNNVNEPQWQQLQLPPPLTCVACLQHVRRPLQRSADSLREHRHHTQNETRGARCTVSALPLNSSSMASRLLPSSPAVPAPPARHRLCSDFDTLPRCR